MICALPVLADAPVSSGTEGAIERTAVQSAGPGSRSSQFDPVERSRGQLQLRWLFQFYEFGDVSEELNVLPVETPPSNWTSIVPQLGFGSPRGFFRNQVGVIASSMGHGTIIRNFTNSPNGQDRRIGLHIEGNLPAGGAEFLIADMLNPTMLLATRVTIRPMVLLWTKAVRRQPVEFDHRDLAKPLGRWITGFTFASDLFAPSTQKDWGTTSLLGFENEIVGIDDHRGRVLGYVDVNLLTRVGEAAGAGTHVGVDLAGTASRFRIEVKAELNFAAPGYVPGYFDQTYVIERNQAFGLEEPKFDLVAPASFGYLGKMSLVYLPYISVFSEITDQIPVNPSEGTNNIRLMNGMSASWLMFQLTFSLSQAGVTNYIEEALRGRGLLFISEGRISLLWSYLQLVGRYFRLHEEDKSSANAFKVIEGGFVGLEVNLGF